MLTLLVLVYSYIMISEASFKNCSIKPVNRCQNLTTESTSEDLYPKTLFKSLYTEKKIKPIKNNIYSFSEGALWHSELYCILFPINYSYWHLLIIDFKNMNHCNSVGVRKETLFIMIIFLSSLLTIPIFILHESYILL